MKVEVVEGVGVKGASQRLDLSECSVRRWADTGDLPSRRDYANRRIFRIADIEKFADARGLRREVRRAR
jgi:predicted site-specific integrase-resolvase